MDNQNQSHPQVPYPQPYQPQTQSSYHQPYQPYVQQYNPQPSQPQTQSANPYLYQPQAQSANPYPFQPQAPAPQFISKSRTKPPVSKKTYPIVSAIVLGSFFVIFFAYLIIALLYQSVDSFIYY